ncbi:MAG: bifunctional riboflavin kinase/FAD synthetase [Chloroflexota bacterium]
MQHVSDLAQLQKGPPTVLTIGAFDGVHLGHQFLIGQVVERARVLQCQSMVLTFDPRPQVFLRPGSLQLSDGHAKMRVIEGLKPDVLAILSFDRALANQPAEVFLLGLIEHVNLAEVWVGGDFAFGHNRTGDVNFLIRNGEAYGFAVHGVSRQQKADAPISSTLIRTLVADGAVREAARYLGHYPGFFGSVVAGYGRGAQLGYPTANVRPSPAQLLPATGIYAGYAQVEERRVPAAISVGYNPVFGGSQIVVEAHLLDFNEQLRDREIGLEFVCRIRSEENFDSVEALVAQMGRDVTTVRNVLAQESSRDATG